MTTGGLRVDGWLVLEIFYLYIVLSDLANKAPCKNSD